MSTQWTVEQVESLSPDAANLKRGKGLATLRKWQLLGKNEVALWGLCKGSGKNPYRAIIDLRKPAFKCSCPSRKFPCKHGLGLFLLYVNHASDFGTTDPPDWVADWLGKRDATEQRKATKAANANKPKTEAQLKAQEKRTAKRLEGVLAGLQELEVWLYDVLRLGIADLQQQSHQYFANRAARMVDAGAPGLGNMVKKLYDIQQYADWQDQTVAQLGYIFMTIKAFQNREQLQQPIQEDIKSLVGLNVKKEEVLQTKGITDTWMVLGIHHESVEQLTMRRTWLLGEKSQKTALLLDFSYGHTGFDRHYNSGQAFEGELCFYPSNLPLRAILKVKGANKDFPFITTIGHTNIEHMLADYANALAHYPFLDRFPTLLNYALIIRKKEQWWVIDDKEQAIPFNNTFQKHWRLLAISGGHRISLFGEWDGKQFLPLGAGEKRRWRAL